MRDADRDSRVSPLEDGDDARPFTDGRRAAAEFREEVTRGEAAERAVAPLAIDGAAGVGEEDCGRRLDPGGPARGEMVVVITEDI